MKEETQQRYRRCQHLTNSIMKNKKQFALLPLAVCMVFPVLESCGATSETYRTYSNAKFLFIDIDGDTTSVVCILFLIIQAVALGLNKFFREKSGWHHQQITRDIYNKDGKKIGSYDTGEYDSWYVSEEKAEKTTTNVRFYSWIARIFFPRAFISGCIASWISPNHPFWAIVIWLCIAPAWAFWRFSKDKGNTSIWWDVVYMVILIIFRLYF